MTEVVFESPLQWPLQQSRTKLPARSRFGDVSTYQSSTELLNELRLLGAKNLVISTNLKQKIRGDGFYSNQVVQDVGVAIYFIIKKENKVMACDKWDKIEHNIWALVLSIRAIRGLDRWGGSEFLDGLFTGFKALPIGSNSAVDYFNDISDLESLKKKFRELAFQFHPDRPTGNHEKFVEMKKQYEEKLLKF